MERPDAQLIDMQQQTPFLKHGRWGDPHFRNFYLSADLRTLGWNTTKKRSSGEGGAVRVADMTKLELGLHSDVFKRKRNVDLMRSFSVYYLKEGAEQTLDVVATDDDLFQTWTSGLRWLIRSSKDDPAALDVAARPLVADVTRSASDAPAPQGAGAAAGGAASNTAMTAQMRSNMQAHQDLYTWGFGGWGQLGHTDTDGAFEDQAEPLRLQIDVEKDVNVRNVACGANHSAIVATDGSVYAWGHAGSGRLGTASGNSRAVEHAASPVRVAALSGVKVTGVSCGHFHSLFLTDTKEVFACGANDCGQLGLGSLADECAPQRVPGLANVGKLAAGGAFSLAVTTAGELFAWGGNDSGELGLGDRESRPAPTQVATAAHWVVTDLHCGDFHALAAASAAGNGDGDDRAVLTWGWGGCGQLGHGDFEDKLVPTPVPILRGKEVRSASCGAAHSAVIVTMAALEIGQLFVWGAAVPVLGAVPPPAASSPDEAPEHHVAIPRWIDLANDQASGKPSGVVAVGCCANNTVVLTDDGTVVRWGADADGGGVMARSVIDLGDKDVVVLACGARHMCITVSRKWITDHEATHCMRCKNAFTFMNRRHHCRNCGGVFDRACSNNFAPLLRLGYTQAVRHCDTCFQRIRRGE